MTVIAFPVPGSQAVGHQPVEQTGDYRVVLKLTNPGRYPTKGRCGDYEPQTVLLVWTTTDGVTWTFRHAVLVGLHVDKNGELIRNWPASQTLYLGDPGYPQCEPPWLADLVTEYQPGQEAR